jgi:hypothetical protein
MSEPLIWLHEEALRVTHPIFTAAPQGTRAVFIWDDQYLQKLDYSFKRLVFIYETLCELPVDILSGDTVAVIKELSPSGIFVPSSAKPHLITLIDQIKSVAPTQVITDDNFVPIPQTEDLRRFFKYWNLAQKTAFQTNGGTNA